MKNQYKNILKMFRCEREKGMLAGILVCISFNSIRQDLMGMEAYITWCREHWVDPIYTIPIAVLLGAYGLYSVYSKGKIVVVKGKK